MDLPPTVSGDCLETHTVISTGPARAEGVPAGPFGFRGQWRSFDRGSQALSLAEQYNVEVIRMATVDILLPTYNRLSSLIMTLSGVAAQTLRDLHVIIADQSAQPARHEQVVQTLCRVIRARGGSVEWHYREPIYGIA